MALISCSNLSAQRYTFRQYGPPEGLTNLTVHCLLQDRTGYIWVGTDNGLFRYDGGKFQKFENAEGLPSAEIHGLAESPEGVLWAATTGGVARLVGRQFNQVEVGEKGQFRAIAFDSIGRLYIKHVSGLVLGVSDEAGSYRFRTVVHGAIRGLSVQGEDVWYDEDGDLWRLIRDKAERVG
jgi:ligand-binding sensor domain-containing protein